MAFERGHPRYGGRKKGAQNWAKSTARELIENILGKSIPERLMELSQGSPDMECKVLCELMPYTYPKLSAVEVTETDEDSEKLDDLIDMLAEIKLDK